MPSSSSEVFLGPGGVQTEKPEHYRYLKEFRVEQCPLFPQHKCLLHRPFLCFHWHFPNQRRRRPVRKRDGTFNYSPDSYCAKYDEGAGLCPDGDDCPYLHRTAGDTERRYHLRYFKTCMCVYETDTKGSCLKNGAHCAFAHGEADKRPPVFDSREVQEEEISVTAGPGLSAGGLLEKNSLMIEDARWQDAAYVLTFYKTDPCRRPPRICRQGYACPHYHNQRDRRRSPQYHRYRSTPCPNVKHGDEWGEPGLCEDSDECSYCHTRTEQQFHPEIYKSSKCHDVFSLSFCPRGPFCAFAHVESEMALNRTFPLEKSSLSNLVGIGAAAASSAAAAIGVAALTSSPIDIQRVEEDRTISYSGAVGGRVETLVTSQRGFMNGLLGYERDEKEEDGCYWLFPSARPRLSENNGSRLSPPDNILLEESSPPFSFSISSSAAAACAAATSPPTHVTVPGLGTSPPQPQQQQQQQQQTSAFSSPGVLRHDVFYAPLASLKAAAALLSQQLEIVKEAISMHEERGLGSTGFCLVCKKDRPRSVILFPCSHQVVCSSCTPTHCPLCATPVRSRRSASSSNQHNQLNNGNFDMT